MSKSQKTVGAIAEIVPTRVVAQAKALLTRAEKQLFDSSFGAALAKHSRAQVQAAVRQARALHAKWRDLAQGQARHTKRAGRDAASANARTREKQELLAGVVARLERRLDELKALVTAAAVPPAARRAKPTAGSSNATAAATRSKKASRRVTSGLEPVVESQLVRLDRARQRSALTAAKASRILRGGQGTQRLGHVAASGRRAQRRRDIRSRG